MRLTELDPHWIGVQSTAAGKYVETGFVMPGGGRTTYWVHDLIGFGGITFLCPLHKNHRLGVAFANPIGCAQQIEAPRFWQRKGETFDTLSLLPSIDTTSVGCWHGFITDGEVK